MIDPLALALRVKSEIEHSDVFLGVLRNDSEQNSDKDEEEEEEDADSFQELHDALKKVDEKAQLWTCGEKFVVEIMTKKRRRGSNDHLTWMDQPFEWESEDKVLAPLSIEFRSPKLVAVLGGKKKLFEWQPEEIQCLWDSADVAGYGNTTTGCTEFDIKNRDARELVAGRDFIVSQDVMTQACTFWQKKHFYPQEVRIEPYKIHLYEAGGHFKSHQDTPATNLVGTFLISLWKNNEEKENLVSNDDEHLSLGDEEGEEGWTASPNSWCAFYSDVLHEVHSIPYSRGILACKVFATSGTTNTLLTKVIPPEQHKYTEVIRLLNGWKGAFGVLLSHKYSLLENVRGCKGQDAFLLTALEFLQDKFQIHFVPVTLRISETREFTGECDSMTSRTCEVYLVRPENILEKDEKSSFTSLGEVTNIPFFEFSARGRKAWKFYEQRGGLTGNEGMNGKLEAVYLYRALIAVPH